MANLSDEQLTKRDRLRFTKNKTAANLALLAIVFDCLYFISIYKSNVGSYYYTLMMGVSVVYNLIFMLVAFLVSEGSKNYMVNYSYIITVVGILQFVRIFIIPARAHSAMIEISGETIRVMGNGQFARVVFYLAASGVCCLASAAVGIIRCRELKEHLSTLVEKTNSEITS